MRSVYRSKLQLFIFCGGLLQLTIWSNVSLAQSGCELNGVKGQTPASAILVCGSTLFIQDTVPDCLNYPLPAPGCRIVGIGDYKDKNPFWFTFTCYSSGTLEFLIDPKKTDDDYNWQFYDITGHGASEIYSDGALVREANWSGSTGRTGASTSGMNSRECESAPSDNIPTFCKPPDIIEGHTYLLLVSHYFDGKDNGFTISFKGGSASITNPAIPDLLSAAANCDGTEIGVKLSKKMNCPTIAADGSDFEILGLSGIINGAFGSGCGTRYNTDSVIISLNRPLAPGTYTVVAKQGSDGNTLIDNCGIAMEVGKTTNVTMITRQPVALDSIITPTCAPSVLRLFFEKKIRCSSVAFDGSDFKIDGPHPVTIAVTNTNCNNDLTNVIELLLSAPITQEGTYTVSLVKGTDGNAITDQCNLETPAGASITFKLKDTVNADISLQLSKGCLYDTVQYFNASGNGKNNWIWLFGDGSSNEQNPQKIYSGTGAKTTQLIVSNGFCKDTGLAVLSLNHSPLKAAFTMPLINCPEDLSVFTDNSTGNIVSWLWQFGNGRSSSLQNPPQQAYSSAATDRLVPVQLVVKNDQACFDTAIQYLKVVSNCYIAVPNAFSPNNDGHNDYLYPLNAYKTTGLEFKVFNRNGRLLFSTTDWTNKWDGTYNSEPQPSGTYVWYLQYTSTDTGKTVFQKGTVVLVR